MIDIKFIREHPDVVRASQKGRGESVELVDQVLAADEMRRTAIVEFEGLRAEQNVFSKSVGAAKGDERTALLEKGKTLSASVKESDQRRSDAEVKFIELTSLLSNLLDPAAPIGGEENFVELEKIGSPRDFLSEGFEPRDHVELGKLLGAIDTERGAKVSGARSYYLTGVGALLEFALVNFAVSSAVKAGFTPVITPVLVNPLAMQGTGFLGQAAENVYHLEEDDVYLVGTSEVALASFHTDEILDFEKLPLRYAGYSTCFRREAGTYGKDTRGIWRVHQFDKVEMFSFCKPEDAVAEHQRLLQPRRYATYQAEFGPYHVMSTVGAYIQLLGFVIAAMTLLHSLFRGKKASANPWGSATLEWTCTSPPPHDNFKNAPTVGDPYDHTQLVWDDHLQGYVRDETIAPAQAH